MSVDFVDVRYEGATKVLRGTTIRALYNGGFNDLSTKVSLYCFTTITYDQRTM